MDFDTTELRQLPLSLPSSIKQIDDFLARFELRRDTLDYYAGLFVNGEMAAGGGFKGNVIKCVAVDPEMRSLGLTNKLISHLRSCLTQNGVRNIFVFTKPKNIDIFESLAFYTIGQAPRAILLESAKRGVSSFANSLSPFKAAGVNGAIVMNCNPFTLGHQYLVETAAKQCGRLHIFVVEEDLSVFPFGVRKKLVEEGTAHIPNVCVHSGGPYIISSATFPSYFIKELDEVAVSYTRLDVDIFAKHIAPALNISLRFAGEEPLDPLTSEYNRAMSELLPASGIHPVIVKRKVSGGAPISASRVRNFLREGDFDAVRELVPASTYDYLRSEAALPVIAKIRGDSV